MDRLRRWGAVGWRLRWRIALALVVLTVVGRLCLPAVLRLVILDRASAALRTRVHVGGVTLSFSNGRFGLHDVAVYPPDEPSGAPLVGWGALDVELSYAALFDRTLRLTEVVLDTPRVAIDRLADGALNLQKLIPPSSAPEAPPPAASEPAPASAWGFALDRFVLRGGGVQFRDFAVPESQPLEAAIPAIEVADVSFRPGVYGAPARLLLDVRSEGSRVRLEATVAMLEKGLALDAGLQATSLPLRRARFYIPGVGWSELAGLADASLRYSLETEKTNRLTGSVAVRELTVKTAGLAEPALAWSRLAVTLAPLDLLARTADVERIELKGASVAATLQGGDVLPIVSGLKSAAAPAAPTAPEETSPPPAAEPWRWSVKRLTIDDSRVVLARAGDPLPIGVRLAASDLAPDPQTFAHVDLGIDLGAGTLETKGRLRLDPPAFGGTLRLRELDVNDVLSAVPTLPQKVVERATVGAEIEIAAGIDGEAKPMSADSLRLEGKLQVDGLRVSAADPKAFSAGWKRLEIAIDELRAPSPLAPGGATAAPRIAISSVRIDEPFANLTRTTNGIVLPALGNSSEAPKGASAPAASPAATTPSPPAPDVRIAALALRGGRVAVVDRTVKPFFGSRIEPIALTMKSLASRAPSVERFELSAAGFQEGKVTVNGSLRAGGEGTIEVNAERVGLMPFNPYVSSASSYSLGKGSLSLATKVDFGADRYDTRNHVTVHELSLQGAEGDALFAQHFGIPLSTALALLTDLNGDISLDVPVVVERGSAKVDLVTVVAGALKSALLGAVLSPLKILGGIAGMASGPAAVEPQPIPVLVGRVDPSPDAMPQIDLLAQLLAGRPGIGIELRGQVSEADVRWLREQKLRADLEEGPGVVGTITTLTTRNARQRILEALVARGNDQAGEIAADDAALLEELLQEVPTPGAEEIGRLALARAERLAAILRDDRGIDAQRLGARALEPVEASAPRPGVLITVALPTS